MLHSGGVRAFSHLPAKRVAADTTGPLSQRGAQALGRQPQSTGAVNQGTPHEDGIAAAKASGVFDVVRQQFNRDDSPHFMDADGNLRPRQESRLLNSPPPSGPRSPQGGAGAPPRPAWGTGNAADGDSSRSPLTQPHVSEDTRPWHSPPIAPEDLHRQHLDDGAADSHSALQGRPEAHDLVYRTQGESPPKRDFNDLVYRFNGSPEEAKEHSRGFYQNVADTRNAPAQRPASAATPPAKTAKSTKRHSEDRPLGYKEKTPPPPPRMVFDEVGPSYWFSNPADLSEQAAAMGLDYSKQANPTLSQIQKRSQTLAQGDIYVYSGHGGQVDGKPHLAAHGEADQSKGETPIHYPRVGLTGSYEQSGTGFAVSQLKDDIAQGKSGVPMMAFISGCEVGAKDLSGLNEAGVSVAISAGGKASERDAPGQMKAFMEVLTKGGTINDALKAVNEIVAQDNQHKFNEENIQEPFTAVFRDGINGDSTLEDIRRLNALVNEARKNAKKETPKP